MSELDLSLRTFKIEGSGAPAVAQRVKNSTSIHEMHLAPWPHSAGKGPAWP